jgi:hypothetical protein
MYGVRWARRALEDLASLWIQADTRQRQAISTASHAVEMRVRNDPWSQSESRDKGCRITFHAPLAVTYRIEADGNTASILQIRIFRKRNV